MVKPFQTSLEGLERCVEYHKKNNTMAEDAQFDANQDHLTENGNCKVSQSVYHVTYLATEICMILTMTVWPFSKVNAPIASPYTTFYTKFARFVIIYNNRTVYDLD